MGRGESGKVHMAAKQLGFQNPKGNRQLPFFRQESEGATCLRPGIFPFDLEP